MAVEKTYIADWENVSIKVIPYTDGSFYVEMTRNDGGESYGETTRGELHALADWIKENVPEAEKTPLPTKFGAVIRCGGELFTLVGSQWENASESCDPLEFYGLSFEVLFDGVDTDET